MGNLSKLARALLDGPSAPSAPTSGSLSALAAQLRGGPDPAANEAAPRLAESALAVSQAPPAQVVPPARTAAGPARSARLSDLASSLAAPVAQGPSPRLSDLAARLAAPPREDFAHLPLAGGYLAWPDVGTRVRWTEETRERHGKVYRHGSVELSGRVTRVDTSRPNDVDVWAAPDGGQERRVGIAGIRVPAAEIPRFVERAKARHAVDLDRNLREMRERDRARGQSASGAAPAQAQAEKTPSARAPTPPARTVEQPAPRGEVTPSAPPSRRASPPQPAPASAASPPAPAPTLAARGVFDIVVSREESRGWTVTLKVLVRRRPKAGHPPTPAKGVARPWHVVTHDDGTDRTQAFWEEPEARAVFEREARQRWAAITAATRTASPPVGPVPPDPATLTSVSALRQLAPGTRLRKQGALPTWDDGLRIVVAVETTPDRLVLQFDDASPKRAGEVVKTSLDKVSVVPVSAGGGMPNGFRIVFPSGRGNEEYRFEDWTAPASMSPWRSALAGRQEANAAQERANVERWAREELAQAQDDIDEAKSPRDRARAEVRHADVAAVLRAGSFRGVDPVRLARLIEHARREEDDYLDDMLAAQEAGAFGAPSGQVGLFGGTAAGAAGPSAPASGRPAPKREIAPAVAATDAIVPARGERSAAPPPVDASTAKPEVIDAEVPLPREGDDDDSIVAALRRAHRRNAIGAEVTNTIVKEARKAATRKYEQGREAVPHHTLVDAKDELALARALGRDADPGFDPDRPLSVRESASFELLAKNALARLWAEAKAEADQEAKPGVGERAETGTARLSSPSGDELAPPHVSRVPRWFEIVRFTIPEGVFENLSNDALRALRRDSKSLGIEWTPPNEARSAYHTAPVPARSYPAVARALAKVPSWSTIDVSTEYVFGSTKASAEYDGFGTVQLAALPDKLRLVAIRGEHQEWQIQRYFSSGTAGFKAIAQAEIEKMAPPKEATADDDSNENERAAAPRDVDATGRPSSRIVHVFVGDARRPSTPAGAASTSRSQAPMPEAAAAEKDDDDAPESSRAERVAPVDPPPAEATANEEDEAQSSRSWARAAALHDAEAMVRMMGPGVQARVGGVVVQATPDWKPPKRGAATQDQHRTRDSAAGDKLQVAKTILEQLGGQRFIAMTGAKNLVGEAHALAFKLPANFAKKGINHVRISLEPSDTYTVRFAKLGRAPARTLTEVAVVEDVYADDLQDVFTRYTGLDTSLVAGRFVATKPEPETLPEDSTPSPAPSAEEEQSDAPDEDDEDAPEPSIVERTSPVEHRTAAARRDANIKAMELAADLEAHPRALTEEERRTLLEYSDWGGVGIGKWASRFPPGFPVPEKRQLIHAYFTPPAVCAEIARVVKPLLPDLVSTDGKVHALEPAAGIGRFPLALSGPGFEALAWHCVEYSTVSYKMLRLLRPDIDLFHGPFERWIAERAEDFAGRLKLVISNPPYGQRNQALTEDPDRSYRLDRADAYFLRRGLDLLGAGGLGIFIIPSGFLTGTTEEARKLREEVLRRHHVAAAFRLPNEVFSLANVVTDILFFRARGAILSEVDDADRFVLEGRYYEEFPGHILGQIVQNEPGKHGWHSTGEGYTVVGEFTAIPPFEERPICSACRHLPAPGPVEPPPTPATSEASKADLIIDRDERMAAAVGLGRRVEAFLASVANPDHEPIGWDELHHDLIEWAETHGAPGKDKDIITLAKAERGPLGRGEPGGAGWLLKAFLGVSSTLIPPLEERPRWAPRFLGDANDPLQVGDYLYRTHKSLRIEDLPGQDPSALFAAGWCEDSLSAGWSERLEVRGELFPPDEYLYGELWPKFDRADARGRLGDVQAAAQARRLLELIQPATFDEIEISPQDGFVPLDLIATWLATLNHGEAVHLVRDKGLVHLADVEYEDHGHGLLDLSQEALLCLGWINHDYVVFQPYAGKDDNIDEIRLGYAKDWTERFRAFCEADAERQRAIERSYQRARQGYRAHGYGSEPLKLLRWNPAIVLNPHQIAGARRLDANGGGGLGFDVGVGKTFTLLAALALARQQGRARRPAIVVPQPIALQWVDNIGKALPDFRVVVIGLNKKTLSRGLRKGLETSETDTPEERSRKWARFQGGEFDVAIVTYESLPRSKMDQDSMLRFIEGVSAIEREVELKRRNAKMQQRQEQKSYTEKKEALEAKLTRAKEDAENRFGTRKQKAQEKQRKLEAKLKELEEKHSKRRLTERQEAILEEGVGAWLAEMLELPEGWKHDPDIVWQKLGITWIAFDEAHNGKNLHMPSSREGGSVPKFMGNEGEGSHRAWHWYFRCCDVQSRGGEVILATATPASNSPLEFYNLVKLIDDKAWARIGIHDPEAFIDRFCLLEPEEVVTVDMQTQTRMACVGFKNLDELRSVVMKLWEFKTAKQAGLKLPTPKIERVFVNMDAAQEKKYQQYVDEIEYALAHPKEGSHKILGLLQRMASVAQHAQLDEKFDWADAHLVASPHSPKYDALAKRVLALRGCGHIVFSDYVPAHAWIRDVLIEAGIPAGRIGILNAVVAPTAADRQRTAREFNGSEGVAPKYDVLIANMIGEEGVDLQRRACAIHHMDIGWTPKKFDQRNGRGYRQGNTLSNIEIIYYIANRSQDGSRLDMVRGKQNWISSLLEGEGKEVNNPAAQSTLTRKELLVLISRDPEKTRARLEAAEAEREEERKKKVAAAASGTLRAVANRFDRARTETNPTVAAEHLSVARQKLAGLAKVDPAIWPWMPWAQEAERYAMLVPKEGGPVYESLRVAMPRLLDRSMIDYAEFGRVDGSTIGTRVAGTAHWDETSLDKVVQLRLEPQMRLAEGSAGTWPADDQAALDGVMTAKWLPRLRSGAGTSPAWTELGWTRAPNGFVERQWTRWGAEIVGAMESTGGWAANLRVPVVTRERLVFGLRSPHGEVIPPTLAGWRRFLELAPASGEKFGALEDVGRWWFGRTIPRNLLSAGRDDDPASSGASSGGASTAPPSKANVPRAA